MVQYPVVQISYNQTALAYAVALITLCLLAALLTFLLARRGRPRRR
jgi:hypothetical protein